MSLVPFLLSHLRWEQVLFSLNHIMWFDHHFYVIFKLHQCDLPSLCNVQVVQLILWSWNVSLIRSLTIISLTWPIFHVTNILRIISSKRTIVEFLTLLIYRCTFTSPLVASLCLYALNNITFLATKTHNFNFPHYFLYNLHELEK